MADMDAITREALKRASQLHSRTAKPRPAPPEPKAEPKANQTENQAPKPVEGLLGSLFKDKDRSIILMLLILLMGEEVEPSLLLALIYILL